MSTKLLTDFDPSITGIVPKTKSSTIVKGSKLGAPALKAQIKSKAPSLMRKTSTPRKVV